MKREIRALAGGHDYVLCHLLRTAVQAEDAPVPKVVELSDSLSLQYERILDVPYVSRKHRILYSIERRRVARLEQQIIESFDLVSMVSHRDAMYLGTSGSNKIRVFPLGIDVKSFHYHERIDRSDRILFLGNMRTAVNQVACLFFAKEVLPLVRKRQPNLKLAVAGLTPKGVARKLVRHEGIELIGPFGDANDVLRNGFCGVAPMVGASGVQSKILEYMASGLPTVASREALSSMTLGRAAPDEIALTGDTASQLADAVLSLWSDAALRTSLAQKARRYVEEHHDWSVCLQPLAREIEDLVERSRAPRVDLQQTRP
ncbi:MAG: glycosyltransferase family 4 protein [Gemmatimonadota bacterium]